MHEWCFLFAKVFIVDTFSVHNIPKKDTNLVTKINTTEERLDDYSSAKNVELYEDHDEAYNKQRKRIDCGSRNIVLHEDKYTKEMSATHNKDSQENNEFVNIYQQLDDSKTSTSMQQP